MFVIDIMSAFHTYANFFALLGNYTQNKLVCENFIFQFIDNGYNGERIF
jgi:hypothetical protein